MPTPHPVAKPLKVILRIRDQSAAKQNDGKKLTFELGSTALSHVVE